MVYATPAELRARFLRQEVDEFLGQDDDELLAALTSASLEIDRARPAGEIDDVAVGILRDVCLTLSRMLAHNEQWVSLDENYPAVREALAARSWLDKLSRGLVALPGGTSEGPHATPVAPTRSMVFGSDFGGQYVV